MGWTSWPNRNFPACIGPHQMSNPLTLSPTVQVRTHRNLKKRKSTRCLECLSLSQQIGMGIASRDFSKESQNNPVLRQLSQVTRRYGQTCLFHPSDGRIHLFTWPSSYIFNTGRQFKRLADRHQRTRLRQTLFTSHHELYRFIRILLGFKNASRMLQDAIDVIP